MSAVSVCKTHWEAVKAAVGKINPCAGKLRVPPSLPRLSPEDEAAALTHPAAAWENYDNSGGVICSRSFEIWKLLCLC